MNWLEENMNTIVHGDMKQSEKLYHCIKGILGIFDMVGIESEDANISVKKNGEEIDLNIVKEMTSSIKKLNEYEEKELLEEK